MSTPTVFKVDLEYAHLLQQLGLDADSIFTDPRIIVWRALPDRENAKLDAVLTNGDSIRLHIKRYPPTAAKMARNEVAGFNLLRDRGVPAALIIASGSRADGSSFVILKDLAGHVPADKLLEQGFDFDRLRDITAGLAANLHNQQLHHRDLYLCHFMIQVNKTDLDAKLIDMARVSRLNNIFTRRRWIVKDLAQFWYSTFNLPISETQRVDWLQSYCAARKIPPRGLINSIKRKSAAIARHDVELRKQQPFRNVSIGDSTA